MRFISILVTISLLLSFNAWTHHSCKTCPVCSLKKQQTETCCENPVEEKSCCSDSKHNDKENNHFRNCNCCSISVAPLQEKIAIIDRNSVSKRFQNSIVSFQTFNVLFNNALSKPPVKIYNSLQIINNTPLTIPLLI
jgi:hypothetical protein